MGELHTGEMPEFVDGGGIGQINAVQRDESMCGCGYGERGVETERQGEAATFDRGRWSPAEGCVYVNGVMIP